MDLCEVILYFKINFQKSFNSGYKNCLSIHPNVLSQGNRNYKYIKIAMIEPQNPKILAYRTYKKKLNIISLILQMVSINYLKNEIYIYKKFYSYNLS